TRLSKKVCTSCAVIAGTAVAEAGAFVACAGKFCLATDFATWLFVECAPVAPTAVAAPVVKSKAAVIAINLVNMVSPQNILEF
ncbi:MAG: hypothetical protein ACREHD_28040, partial [Pirellulales bacterium]